MTAHAWGCIDDALPWRRVVVTDGERSREVTADVCAAARRSEAGDILLTIEAEGQPQASVWLPRAPAASA